MKSNEENKTIEINDLKVFTRYSVVITAFIGNVSGAYAEGKSSAEVIITTLESGKEYFSPFLTINWGLAVGLSYSSSHSPGENVCAMRLIKCNKIKINDGAIDKYKVCLHFWGKVGCVEHSILVNMEPN